MSIDKQREVYSQAQEIDQSYITELNERYKNKGWNPTKWSQFSERMLQEGYSVYLYESKTTRSKYLFVQGGNKVFKVRFSNHKPNKSAEISQDSDFYVGVSHLGVTRTEDAIKATIAFLRGDNEVL